MAASTKTKIKNDENNTTTETSEVNDVDIDEGKKAKKEKKKKEKDKKGKKGKKKWIFLILLLLIAAVAAIFVFNPLNIRDDYFYPALRSIPVVKNIIPAEESEKDEYSGLTREQLVVQNKKLEAEKKALEEEKSALSDRADELDKELVRLREIEANQLEFKAEKEEFDRMIAENDPNAYMQFYESIDPENAETLYREAAGDSVTQKELKQYVQTFENMKKDAAAKVLEEMIGTDMELVVRILNNISSEQRGAILGAMEPENAAAAVKQMAPDEQQNN